MKNSVVFLVIFFCVYFRAYATDNISEIFEKAHQLLATNPDSAILQVDNLNDQIDSYTIKEQVLFHHKAAGFFGRIGDFKRESNHWAQEVNLTTVDADSIHKSVYRLGQSYLNQGESDLATEQFELCQKYAIERMDTFVVAATYDALASVMSQIGDREGAIAYYLKSIRVLEKLGKNSGLAQAYINMGVAYFELDDLEKAMESRKNGTTYAELTGNPYLINKARLAVAGSYNSFDQPDSALHLLLPTVIYFESENNLRFLNGTYNELGITYSNLGKPDSAIMYYEKSIALLKGHGYSFALPGTLVNYGHVLNKTGKYSEAVQACQEALPIVRTLSYPSLESEICGCLYANFKAVNQTDSALHYYELQLMLEDSINNVEIQKSILEEEMESSFSQEKEVIIADANAVIAEEKSLRMVWVIGAFILLAALVILYLAFRQKQKSNAIIQREKHYLDNLLHNLVHEFRTPLTLIKGPTEELLKKDSENKLLKLVDKNSDQMLSLVNQVLDFAKIKAGRLEVKNEITNLHLFTNDTIALFEPIAREKKVTLSNDVQNKKSSIKVDGDKLFKIISNLLTNAIKYSNDGAKVVLKTNVINGFLIVEVSDTGIGISTVDQEKVFDKFYQVDATITRKGEGTGLGLAFVKELVQLMNGEISLTSKLGQGTNVQVKLPVKMVEDYTESTSTLGVVQEEIQTLKRTDTIDTTTNKSKILVVEDNSDLQDFLNQILTAEGYEVHSAMNGLLGVEKALEIIPDLVISDVMMPEMDGYQVVQQLKNNFATEHIPIVILTAKSSFDSMIEGLGSGADDYLSKPFKSQELILRVTNQIKRQQILQQKYLQPGDTEVPVVKHALIEKIEEITKADLTTQLTVEELAEKCALSRSQLHRKVKFVTGLSTTGLLTKIRLDLALDDLRKTDLTVSEIAYNYGYNDPAHFTKLFKKEFSKTPSEARK